MTLSTKEVQELILSLEKEAAQHKENAVLHENLEVLKGIARKYSGEGAVISSLEHAEKLRTRPTPPWIKSTISGLDAILTGFLPGQLITVAAPTKHGKTQFCVELTIRLQDQHPLWLPFEESTEELIQKFLDRGEEPPLFYAPETMTGDRIPWIEMKIVEAIAKYNSKIVFIDHLHRTISFSSERIDLRIGEAMQAYRGIAKKWGVTVFVIVHLKKTRMEEHPDLEDLRDSSFVAQESDTVIMLWRETTKESGGPVVVGSNVNLSVQANRRTGKTGNVQMIFTGGRFLEQAWESDAETRAKQKRAEAVALKKEAGWGPFGNGNKDE